MSLALISWQSIIAGAVAALAVSIVMAVLGVALGFSVVKPKSHEPASGLGVAFGVWSIISVIVSLAVGGYIAGMFSGARGIEHGFMVWATVLIAGTLFSGLAVSAAMRLVGSAVRGIGSGAASVATSMAPVASSVGHGVSGMASSAYDRIHDYVQEVMDENLNIDFDTGELKGEIGAVLQDTDVETLQPEYLKRQMQEVKKDLREAVHQFRLNSENYDTIAANFLKRQKERLETITKNVDKDAAVHAVMNNRGIPESEARREVDNAIRVYNKAVCRAERAVHDVKADLHDARERMMRMSDHARIRADKMASSAAKSALAAAIALVLGAVICCYAASRGNRHADWNTAFIVEQRRIDLPVVERLDPVVRQTRNVDTIGTRNVDTVDMDTMP